MAEAAVPKQPLPTQSTPRQPHPDLAAAMESAQRSREYHISRIDCTNKEYAKLYEKTKTDNKSRPNNLQFPNPPVGEFCLAQLQHSTDIQRNSGQLAERPEKSLLAPYIAIMADKEYKANEQNGRWLLSEYAQKIQQNSGQPDMIIGLPSTQAPTPKVAVTQGTAFDTGYTYATLVALEQNKKLALSARPADELYNTTEQCFRNDPKVTLGQCFQTGVAQASIYLNQDSTAALPTLPSSSPNKASATKALGGKN